MTWRRLSPPRLRSNESGVTAVEFALIAPVFLIGLLGAFDLGHNMYTKALLQGAIQKAARDSTIEGAGAVSTDLDNRVARVVHDISPNAALTFERSAYSTFSDVAQPEDYTDTNGNDTCDGNEPFEDANGNGTWDTDRGIAGMGGARDAVAYKVTVTYPRLFPIAGFIGGSNNFTTSATTILRNQPFALQHSVATVGNC